MANLIFVKEYMNKRERFLKGRQAAARRARKCGWTDKFENLPIETQKAFISPNNIRISRRNDRKRFGKSSKKRYYGHFLGLSNRHLPKKDLQERDKLRELENEDFI